ncbi:methyltransferase domain-containing protein [Maribellus comscasis]|uniref:Methyltransferase domain-containing protein n=2 Tax=Maribellus comscasis TaxID=2681766 RepID=A0A6I6JWM9_9BACT|nr:methyltransferase domain-containing protein [Maribellus comscasis]
MDLIETNSTVIEFGCGNGDLLLKLSSQIKYGLGIDKSKRLIDYATQQKRKMNLNNVDFRCEELNSNYKQSGKYDYSVASLFFHVIPWSDSIYLMKKMQEISDKIVICGFSRPGTLQQKTLLWIDQKSSSHYQHFKAYKKRGYLEGILSEIRSTEITTFDTHIPFVKIHVIGQLD